jgi:hypothetical protein
MRDFGSGDQFRPDIRFSDLFAIIGVPASVMFSREPSDVENACLQTPDIRGSP